MQKSEAVDKLFKALVIYRTQLIQPKKDAKNIFLKSNYVTLEGVQKSIDEAIKGTGLSYAQWLVNGQDLGTIGVITLIMHDSGQFMEFDPFYLKPEKNTPQAAGSAATYARRYSLSTAFGISSDIDDDGNEASGQHQQIKKTYQKAKANKEASTNKPFPANESKVTQGKNNIVNDSQKIAAMMNVKPKAIIETAMQKNNMEYSTESWVNLTEPQAELIIKTLNEMQESTKKTVETV